MTFTPAEYCEGYNVIIVSSDNDDHDHLTGTYTIAHISSIGVKYVNTDKGTKITFSEKVNNIHDGHWRWAKDSPPYTLYYANPSKQSCIPTSGWFDLSESLFTGDIRPSGEDYDLYIPCDLYNVYKKCGVEITPTPTPVIGGPTPTPVAAPEPTPTPSLPAGEILYRNDHTELIWVKAKPTITYIDPWSVTTSGGRVRISGLSMHYTEHVYIRGVPWMFSSSLEFVDMFGDIPSMRDDYPGFDGLRVPFKVIDENYIDVDLPEFASTGLLDVVIINRGGYGTITPAYYTSDQWTDYNLQNRFIAITN